MCSLTAGTTARVSRSGRREGGKAPAAPPKATYAHKAREMEGRAAHFAWPAYFSMQAKQRNFTKEMMAVSSKLGEETFLSDLENAKANGLSGLTLLEMEMMEGDPSMPNSCVAWLEGELALEVGALREIVHEKSGHPCLG
jgi:hypothetical protein